MAEKRLKKEEIEEYNKALIEAFKRHAEVSPLGHYVFDDKKKYVETVISENRLIEGYAISIQYAEDSMSAYLDEKGILEEDQYDDKWIRNYQPVANALYAMGIINGKFQKTFEEVCTARHKIVHSIGKKIELVKKFNAPKYKKLPIDLIDLADDFIIISVLKKLQGKEKINRRLLNKVMSLAYGQSKKQEKEPWVVLTEFFMEYFKNKKELLKTIREKSIK